MRYKISLVLIGVITSQFLNAQLPEGFTALTDSIPDLLIELRYAGANNFMGRPVAGYNDRIGIGTSALAHHLNKVQTELKLMGLGLKIYDAYRPQTAVNDFIRWSKIPGDTLTKHIYYPTLVKNRLFDLGFIASKSGHSRGSTVDLSLIYLEGENKGNPVDMGSPWDFFGDLSNFNNTSISKKQKVNRILLRELMLANGFKPYEKEWWHFTLNQEPFTQTYFDFPIEFP